MSLFWFCASDSLFLPSLCGWVRLGVRGGLVSCWLLMYVMRKLVETALPSSDSAIGLVMLCELTQEAKSINNSDLTTQALSLWDAETWPCQIPAAHPHLGRQSKQPWAGLSPAPCHLHRAGQNCTTKQVWTGLFRGRVITNLIYLESECGGCRGGKEFALKQWRRKCESPEVHRKTEAHVRQIVQCRV